MFNVLKFWVVFTLNKNFRFDWLLFLLTMNLDWIWETISHYLFTEILSVRLLLLALTFNFEKHTNQLKRSSNLSFFYQDLVATTGVPDLPFPQAKKLEKRKKKN